MKPFIIILDSDNGKPLKWIMNHASYDSDECLYSPYGTNTLLYNGRHRTRNSIMCELAHGESGSSKLIAINTCGNPGKCINPKHLKWGVHKDKFSKEGRKKSLGWAYSMKKRKTSYRLED